MVHSTDNYTIGKGILYVGDVKASPSYVEIGNCPSISLEITEERLEHFSSRGGLKNRDLYPLVQVKYTVTFDCEEITKENLLKFLHAEDQGDWMAALQDFKTEYSLKFEEDNPIGPSRVWKFHRGILSANGALEAIGDDWKKLSFKFEGLTDDSNHSSSPYFDVCWTSTSTVITTAPPTT